MGVGGGPGRGEGRWEEEGEGKGREGKGEMLDDVVMAQKKMGAAVRNIKYGGVYTTDQQPTLVPWLKTNLL